MKSDLEEVAMSPRYKLITRGIILASLIAAISIVWYTLFSGVVVQCENGTMTPITSLRVLYNGGEATVPSLGPAEVRRVRIRPVGESNLAIEYRTAIGEAYSKKFEVYLERNHHGRLKVFIAQDGPILTGTTSR